MTIKQIEKASTQAVKLLRKKKLEEGLTFMINTSDLPSSQCYLEYPDGHIRLVRIGKDKIDFEIITEFTLQESNNIRKKYKII